MSAPDFHIPVEKEITQFAQHLQTHHRTILSAKFGDGKSYFIDKFEKDKGVSAELKIVKVYPVNYQIASNTDIFTNMGSMASRRGIRWRCWCRCCWRIDPSLRSG